MYGLLVDLLGHLVEPYILPQPQPLVHLDQGLPNLTQALRDSCYIIWGRAVRQTKLGMNLLQYIELACWQPNLLPNCINLGQVGRQVGLHPQILSFLRILDHGTQFDAGRALGAGNGLSDHVLGVDMRDQVPVEVGLAEELAAGDALDAGD